MKSFIVLASRKTDSYWMFLSHIGNRYRFHMVFKTPFYYIQRKLILTMIKGLFWKLFSISIVNVVINSVGHFFFFFLDERVLITQQFPIEQWNHMLKEGLTTITHAIKLPLRLAQCKLSSDKRANRDQDVTDIIQNLRHW